LIFRDFISTRGSDTGGEPRGKVSSEVIERPYRIRSETHLPIAFVTGGSQLVGTEPPHPTTNCLLSSNPVLSLIHKWYVGDTPLAVAVADPSETGKPLKVMTTWA